MRDAAPLFPKFRKSMVCSLLFLALLFSASAHGGDSDSGSERPDLRGRPLLLVKIWYLVLVFVGTFVGGMSPYFMKWNEGFLILGTQFAGRVFLGTALMHFLSDSNETFGDLTGKQYPFAFMLAFASYLLTMFADGLVSYVYAKSQNGCAAAADLELQASSHPREGNNNGIIPNSTLKESAAECHFAKIPLAAASSFGDSVLLIVALCFHSVFEGIAIGVSETKADACEPRGLSVYRKYLLQLQWESLFSE